MINNIDITLLAVNIVSILCLTCYKYIKKTKPNTLFFQGLLVVVLLYILYLLFMVIVIKSEDAMYLVIALMYQTIYFPFVGLVIFLISIANNKEWILSNKIIVCRYALLLFIFIVLDIYWIIMALF